MKYYITGSLTFKIVCLNFILNPFSERNKGCFEIIPQLKSPKTAFKNTA